MEKIIFIIGLCLTCFLSSFAHPFSVVDDRKNDMIMNDYMIDANKIPSQYLQPYADSESEDVISENEDSDHVNHNYRSNAEYEDWHDMIIQDGKHVYIEGQDDNEMDENFGYETLDPANLEEQTPFLQDSSEIMEHDVEKVIRKNINADKRAIKVIEKKIKKLMKKEKKEEKMEGKKPKDLKKLLKKAKEG